MQVHIIAVGDLPDGWEEAVQTASNDVEVKRIASDSVLSEVRSHLGCRRDIVVLLDKASQSLIAPLIRMSVRREHIAVACSGTLLGNITAFVRECHEHVALPVTELA